MIGFGHPPRLGAAPDGWIVGEHGDRSAVAQAVRGADVVFHLLGMADPGGSNRDPGEEARVGIPANIGVLEACRDAEVGKLVFLSSGGTVYRPNLPLPIGEDAPTDPVSAYGVGKIAAEKFCILFRHLYGLDVVTLRVANPFGPHQSPHRGQGFIAKLMHAAITGQPMRIWGDGNAVRDFLFIEDAVRAMVAAAVTPDVAGPLNIGSGVGRTLRSVIDDVGAMLGRQVPVGYEPARAADTPANTLDITRAAREIGWRPRTAWTDGLRRTHDWLLASG